MSTSGSRDAILAKVREALKTPSHKPAVEQTPIPSDDPHLFGGWLPQPGADWDAQWQTFCDLGEKLRNDVLRVSSEAELLDALLQLKQEHGWERVASHHTPHNDAGCTALNLPVTWTDAAYAIADLEACDAGISSCEALVAQTGSVLVTNAGCGGRTLNVLPTHHVVIATPDQLVADLSAAYDVLTKKYGADYPSLISFITGASRTGDIERILVLGAHGPKRLTVILVEG